MLKKLGEAMGMPVASFPGQTAPAEPEVVEEGEEEESIVHQTASLGDVEVRLRPTLLDVHMLVSFMCCPKELGVTGRSFVFHFPTF